MQKNLYWSHLVTKLLGGLRGIYIQHVVVWSQRQECGLKYVMYTPGGPVWTSDEYAYTEQWDNSDMVSISKTLTHG